MKHAYGWLRGNRMVWKGGLGGGALVYDYGWPAGGTAEPNVALQLLFDESSGNITDEVGSLEFIGTGNPGYSTAATGSWARMSPGIKFVKAVLDKFTRNGAQATLANGTDDAVFEWVLRLESGGNNAELVWDTYASSQGTLIEFIRSVTPTYSVRLRFIGPGGTLTVSINHDGSTYGDGKFHKWRLSVDRSGNCELFIDGVSQGTANVSAHAANNIPAEKAQISGPFGGEIDMTILEYRMTIGNATNNSGGPGGG